jgi:hypothetical protein
MDYSGPRYWSASAPGWVVGGHFATLWNLFYREYVGGGAWGVGLLQYGHGSLIMAAYQVSREDDYMTDSWRLSLCWLTLTIERFLKVGTPMRHRFSFKAGF